LRIVSAKLGVDRLKLGDLRIQTSTLSSLLSTVK